MNLPSGLQEKITTYTREAGYPVRSGDKFLSSKRDIAAKMKKCGVCGICVQTKQTSNECILFKHNPEEVVFQKNELCRTLCLQKNGLSLFEKFIKHLLEAIVSKQSKPSLVMLVLTPDKAKARFIFQVVFRNNKLDIQFFPNRSPEYSTENFLPYTIGDKITATKWYPKREDKLKTLLRTTFEELNGQKHKLFIESDTLPRRDEEIAGINCKFINGYHVAPVYLFATHYT